MAKLIKAFHQVGGDDKTPAERKAFLDQILALGEIIPAIERVQRREMYNECFTSEAQGGHSVDALRHGAGPEFRDAVTLMAREKVELLPEDGTTHTMFNCLDLIAGDFELVFLSIGDWYNYPSGFVFDAEALLMSGARYRSKDLLGYYGGALEEVGKYTYDSVEDARREIEDALKQVQYDRESTGKEAIYLLRSDCSGKQGCPGEIVWPGSLPLGLAIETWREGRKMTFREGVRR
mgnify:CR=1 FL=1